VTCKAASKVCHCRPEQKSNDDVDDDDDDDDDVVAVLFSCVSGQNFWRRSGRGRRGHVVYAIIVKRAVFLTALRSLWCVVEVAGLTGDDQEHWPGFAN